MAEGDAMCSGEQTARTSFISALLIARFGIGAVETLKAVGFIGIVVEIGDDLSTSAMPASIISAKGLSSSMSKSFIGELAAELSEYPDCDDDEEGDPVALFLFLVREDLSRRESMSGRFFLGRPRLTTLRTIPSNAPIHMPLCR